MGKFEKGHSKVGGKVKGTENKATKDIKEAYRLLIENNLDNLTLWLAQIAKKNPEKAIYILYNLSEFVIPKLARQNIDLSSTDGTMATKPNIYVTSEQVKQELDKLMNA